MINLGETVDEPPSNSNNGSKNQFKEDKNHGMNKILPDINSNSEELE